MQSVKQHSHVPPPTKKAKMVHTVEPHSVGSGTPEQNSAYWWLEKIIEHISGPDISRRILQVHATRARAKHIVEGAKRDEVTAGKLRLRKGEEKLRAGLAGMQKETNDLRKARAVVRRELEDMSGRKLALEEGEASLRARDAKMLVNEARIRMEKEHLQVEQSKMLESKAQVHEGITENRRDAAKVRRGEEDLRRRVVGLEADRKEVRKTMAKAQKVNAEALETLVASRISERAVNEAGEQRRKWEDKTKQRLRNSGAKGFPQ